MGMELVQQALSLYRRRHFTECAEVCERDSSSRKLQWIGMLALTQHAWLDELELEGLESLAEELLDNQATAQTGRPGTSLRAPPPPTGGGRPMTREGRPLTGLRRRPRTRTAAQQGVERALSTAAGRTARIHAHTARPTTAAPGVVQELGRLGAAASGWPDKPWLSKPLFRFLYHQRGDVRQALELASQERSTDCCGWWSLQRGRCLLRLGMLREAEHQFRKAAEAGDPQPRAFLWLARVQLHMDQPLAAVEAYRRGLDRFPNEAALVAPMARVYEGLHDLQRSAKLYRELLSQDAVHVEAIACVATHHFYADQPEMALRFYRRSAHVFYVDHGFEFLPARRVLAADGLHTSFEGTALLASHIKDISFVEKRNSLSEWNEPTVAEAAATETAEIPLTSQEEFPRLPPPPPHPAPSLPHAPVTPTFACRTNEFTATNVSRNSAAPSQSRKAPSQHNYTLRSTASASCNSEE
ncbi:hypothetical protein HPB50_015884 [Hyalomma asiaticum]|uniref:Uncharacterized protein n=1 Tax=Hyalomma asiaticum TaxID=266040 RepID=A0ACB7RWM3_HYAAI|nr:hypothetical protein HPB50_015884 [Hyalomma asiaticum]